MHQHTIDTPRNATVSATALVGRTISMRHLLKIAVLILMVALITGCAQNGGTVTKDDPDVPLAAPVSTFEIPIPSAPGINVEQNDRAKIDYSNIQYGYVIVEFTDTTNSDLKVMVTAPHNEKYVFALSSGGIAEIIPLTEGNGEYMVGVYEHVEYDSYAQVLTLTVNVELIDALIPFLHPNQFVNYTRESELVALAAELTKNATTTHEKIEAIYNYVVKNFTYDFELAETVQSGYLPNLDEVLHRKKGICFDYSALVTAMLRSQGIPARLEIGYHGEQYHAWISKYCENDGWIERAYNYDGEEWQMSDPTEESGAQRAHRSRQEALNDEEYRLLYSY